MDPDRFEFTAEVWLHVGPAAWHFISVPDDVADEIRAVHGGRQKAFGSLAVTATIGATAWQTSLFWDRERETYLLPLKSAVRKSEDIEDGDEVTLLLRPAS